MIDSTNERAGVCLLARKSMGEATSVDLRALIESDSDWGLVQCSSSDQLLEWIAGDRLQRPGCLVVDVELIGDGFQRVQKALSDSNCSVPLILVAGELPIETVIHAFEKGAWSVVLKSADGVQKFSGSLRDHIHQAIDWDGFQVGLEKAHRKRNRILEGLTERQRKVLNCVMDGMPTKAIAANYKVSKRLIEFERSHLLSAFGVAGTAELTAVVGEHRIIEQLLGRYRRVDYATQGRTFQRPMVLRGSVSRTPVQADD
ncbi:response regulator transcription factor [Rhodopirellula islandica]|uniref:response regulator transcription factor n=1 Tax=Rhodopirellula islandica TaxID=595434 RepID=UPI0006496F88|nr:LuxR C-terminal-related transcriptional regulator [Rhodopirellula islandica]